MVVAMSRKGIVTSHFECRLFDDTCGSNPTHVIYEVAVAAVVVVVTNSRCRSMLFAGPRYCFSAELERVCALPSPISSRNAPRRCRRHQRRRRRRRRMRRGLV
jgi:hypothetical protein